MIGPSIEVLFVNMVFDISIYICQLCEHFKKNIDLNKFNLPLQKQNSLTPRHPKKLSSPLWWRKILTTQQGRHWFGPSLGRSIIQWFRKTTWSFCYLFGILLENEGREKKRMCMYGENKGYLAILCESSSLNKALFPRQEVALEWH